MKISTATVVFALLGTLSLAALERLPLNQIDVDELVAETQIDASRSKDHLAYVWYIPPEYWEATLKCDSAIPKEQKNKMLLGMKTLTVIAVVQGDVPPVGPIRYYNRDYFDKTLKFTYVDEGGRKQPLTPYRSIDGDLKRFLESIAPLLAAALGGLGENLQFYVFSDLSISHPGRLVDPCLPGAMLVDLKRRDGKALQAKIEFPLNALFKPRLCPNGKPAHVSWKFCPWTGKKLPQ